tara:strand:+ start:658 stop:1836 length:1179 start_codon:yes stop_codon:yes gene_type:complete
MILIWLVILINLKIKYYIITKKMKFSVNQQDLQQALNYCQGIIEKRSTLPILSNILLDISNTKLTITATDLDLIFIHQIKNVEVLEEGKITTSSSIMYDIVRKFSSGKKINLNLNDTSKLHLESEKSVFNLNCISAAEFPVTDENFNENEFSIKSKQLLKLLNKCKFSISNDETRHYLSGIYFHTTEIEDKNYLTAAATDSHRMSISKIKLDKKIIFEPIILPKKTIYQLCSLLDDYDGEVKISNLKSKIKFELSDSILISKLIDGKFPNYIQVIPKNNQKKLDLNLKLFLDSVDRVASVSLDKKDGVKFDLKENTLDLSVNNTNSGDGKETLVVKFDHELEISFNSRYLIDVASQLDGDRIELFFNDTGSPALIKDPSDFDSIFVVMPMKG